MGKDTILTVYDIRQLSEVGVPITSVLCIILTRKYECLITFDNVFVMLSNRCIMNDILEDTLLYRELCYIANRTESLY